MGDWPPYSMRGLDLIFGVVAPVIQLAILLLFVLRKLYREFPFFFLYTVCSIIFTIGRLSIITQPRLFFVVYWSTEIVYGFLALAAIYEVFEPALHMYYSAHHWARGVPGSAFFAILGNALWQAAFHPLGHTMMARLASGAYSLMPGILLLETTAFILCLRLALKNQFPIAWGRHRAGILIGFGLAACAAAAADVSRRYLGIELESIFRYLPAGAYIGATVIWFISFWWRDATRNPYKPNLELLQNLTESMSRATARAKEELLKLCFSPALKNYSKALIF